MNTVQLTAIMDKILCNTHFLGVLPSDHLPEKPLKTLPALAIINTDPSDLPGEQITSGSPLYYLERIPGVLSIASGTLLTAFAF